MIFEDVCVKKKLIQGKWRSKWRRWRFKRRRWTCSSYFL